jgi:Histone methylation protein DOT1
VTAAFESDLAEVMKRMEQDIAIFEPVRLRARMDALDELDTLIPESRAIRVDAMFAHAIALREKLEAANAAVYAAIRDEVRGGAGAECLRKWIEQCGDVGAPRPGLGYDHLDDLIAGVLALREPVGEAVLEPEMVFYQPTPARHILEMIRLSDLAENDVLMDLGSGLGHVPMLASILTGARAMGIEIDAAYVRCARECADNLGLDRVTFVGADAREADLSAGTVFHLYTPFTGGMLRTVMDDLRSEGERREIRLCTLGPCTAAVAGEPWLRAETRVDGGRIACFRTRRTSRVKAEADPSLRSGDSLRE